MSDICKPWAYTLWTDRTWTNDQSLFQDYPRLRHALWDSKVTSAFWCFGVPTVHHTKDWKNGANKWSARLSACQWCSPLTWDFIIRKFLSTRNYLVLKIEGSWLVGLTGYSPNCGAGQPDHRLNVMQPQSVCGPTLGWRWARIPDASPTSAQGWCKACSKTGSCSLSALICRTSPPRRLLRLYDRLTRTCRDMTTLRGAFWRQKPTQNSACDVVQDIALPSPSLSFHHF